MARIGFPAPVPVPVVGKPARRLGGHHPAKPLRHHPIPPPPLTLATPDPRRNPPRCNGVPGRRPRPPGVRCLERRYPWDRIREPTDTREERPFEAA